MHGVNDYTHGLGRTRRVALQDPDATGSASQSLLVAYLGESYLLADQLKRLEQAGLIRRVPYGEHPPRVDYHLTAEGRALGRAVEALADWGLEHFPLTKRIVWPGADRDEAR